MRMCPQCAPKAAATCRVADQVDGRWVSRPVGWVLHLSHIPMRPPRVPSPDPSRPGRLPQVLRTVHSPSAPAGRTHLDLLFGGSAGAVEDTGGGANVHVQGGAVVGVAG